MPDESSKDFWMLLLTNVRNATQREAAIFQELSQLAQDPDVKEALEARVFLSEKTLGSLDQCFRLIGEQPIKTTVRVHDFLIEELRKDIAGIQSPVARNLLILAKAQQLIQFRIGEYNIAMTATVDMRGDYGVGVWLESALAEKLAFVERTRRLIQRVMKTKARLAAA
jgi:ferritin-like metal-binding protein YciE